jgi:hypothetical protein
VVVAHAFSEYAYPIFLLWAIRREQTVMNAVTNLLQRRGNDFREAFLVTDLIHKGLRRDNDAFPTSQMEFPDWSWLDQSKLKAK